MEIQSDQNVSLIFLKFRSNIFPVFAEVKNSYVSTPRYIERNVKVSTIEK